MRTRLLVTCLILFAVASVACSGTGRRYQLTPASLDGRQVMYLDLPKEPLLIRPLTAGEGVAAGVASGIFQDCLFWLCIPIESTLGTLGAVAASDTGSNVRAVLDLLARARVVARLPDLLMDRVIEHAAEMSTYSLERLDASPPEVAAALTENGRLTLVDAAVGLLKGKARGQYRFVVAITGRVGKQGTDVIRYESPDHDLEYWSVNDGANITKEMDVGVAQISQELVRTVFVRNAAKG